MGFKFLRHHFLSPPDLRRPPRPSSWGKTTNLSHNVEGKFKNTATPSIPPRTPPWRGLSSDAQKRPVRILLTQTGSTPWTCGNFSATIVLHVACIILQAKKVAVISPFWKFMFVNKSRKKLAKILKSKLDSSILYMIHAKYKLENVFTDSLI